MVRWLARLFGWSVGMNKTTYVSPAWIRDNAYDRRGY